MSRQSSLEEEMMHLGKSRFEARVSRAKAHNQMSTTPAGQHLLREAVNHLSTALRAWVEKVDKALSENRGRVPTSLEYVKAIGPDVAALLTAKTVIDNICRRQKMTSAAVQLGTYMEDEARMVEYQNIDPLHYEIVQERSTRIGANKRKRKEHLFSSMEARQMSWEKWPARNRLRLGAMCIEMLAQETGLITLKTLYNRQGKSEIHIIPTKETLKWLDKAHEENSVLFPFYLPCVQLPKDWTTPHNGGYHTNVVLQKPLVKHRDRNYQEELKTTEMPEVYQAVNALQRTSWSVNTDVAAVMRYAWEEDLRIAGLPSRDELEIPPRPADIETNEIARREWRKHARATVEKNLQSVGMRVQMAQILFMSDRFQEIGRFWYPYTLDFRGRTYPVPYFLQPQGPDEARGLLQFADGVPLGAHGVRWLAIHGANTWGADKCSFDERVSWVEEHEEMILSVGEDPMSDLSWAEADKPWSFLAFCLEWWRLDAHVKSGSPASEYQSHLPVAMDGSNNGLQIFSLLLRDETSGAATNCTPQLIPADIYQTIADALTLKLAKAQTQGNEQERGWAKQWLQFVGGRMPRKATKRVVMVVPYGGTMHSAQKYLMEWYDDAVAGGAEAIWPFDKFNPTMFLARQLWEVIQENIHSARACMAWFQEVSSICSEHGVPIRWTTPTGFPVKQDYKKFRTDMVETKVGEKVRRLSLRQDTETISPRRQRNGISPNFVHSLDATCLHRVVCRLHDSGVRDFAMIHDSYAVHAAHVPELNRVTREVYRDVFSSDLLNTFRAEVQAHLPSGVVLPDPPVAGTLNVEGLVDADYFFA